MSETPQPSERLVYNPTVLTIDPSPVQTNLLSEVMTRRGVFERASNAREAIERIQERGKPFDIILLLTGREERLKMPIREFIHKLKEVSPGSLPALMTGGETGEQGVPSLKELEEMGIVHVYEAVKYPVGLQGWVEFVNEVRTASYLRKQRPPQ